MKSFKLVPLLLLASVVPGISQINLPPVSTQPAFPIVRIYIPSTLEVAPFVPPVPGEVKQGPDIRKDAVVTVPTENGKTMTIIRGEASDLPDIPAPPQPVRQAARQFTEEETARAAETLRHTIKLGAVVFDHRFSVVHWQHPDTGENYEAVCGFDLGLLEGVDEFVSKDGIYQLHLIHTPYDTTRSPQMIQRMFPELPQVSAGNIVFIKGNSNDAIGTASITLARDLIATEKLRLHNYQMARRNYQMASEAWHAAHPTVPRDETFWLRPHRGSRYLANPRPEASAR